ncbi:MAG: hypothetical protein ACOZBL_02560 [Patescibacteria group bacterium]
MVKSLVRNVARKDMNNNAKLNLIHNTNIETAKRIGLYILKTEKPITCLKILTIKATNAKANNNEIRLDGNQLYIR